MRIFLLDNYDSFTYNLYQYIAMLGVEVVVRRNDQFDLQEVEDWEVDGAVISPGPSRPERSRMTVAFIKRFAGRLPILGVCLGHQAIAYAFGAKVVRSRKIMHGKTSEIFHDGRGVFYRLPNPFTATRYHSLIVDKNSLPDDFEISAWTLDDEVMGIRHKSYILEGVQFHPESVLTEDGIKIVENYLNIIKKHGGGENGI